MKIELNEKAAEYFNEKAKEFLLELKPDQTIRPKVKDTESSLSHIHTTVIDGKDILDFSEIGYVNSITGKQAAHYFLTDKGPIGLNQNIYVEFEKLLEALYEKAGINSVLSKEYLVKCIFKWFEDRYKGVVSKDKEMIQYVIENSEKDIQKYKIAFPIDFIAIEKPFKIGDVNFDYITKDFCDELLNKMKFSSDSGVRFRKKYQGAVLASISIESEKQKCMELAHEKVSNALTILRFFSPSALNPDVPSYFGFKGRTYLPADYYFSYKDYSPIPIITEEIAEKKTSRWDVTNKLIEIFQRESGFKIATDMFFNINRTEFEELILNSIRLYERSVKAFEFQDKIVYVLVSAETLLLKNDTEPIQSNVGRKLAFLTENTAEKRKEVIKNLNEAYKCRSSYIHHGKRKDDWDILKTVQFTIWSAIINAIISSDKFKTPKDFQSFLETKMLSG